VNPLRIVIVDDHQLFSFGLKVLLERSEYVDKVFVAIEFDQIQNFCLKEAIDLVIMDVNLENACGAQFSKDLKVRFPAIKILAFSAHKEESYIARMLNAGVSGYLFKDTDLEELLMAIKLIVKGKNYFASTLSEILIAYSNKQGTKSAKRKEILTLREFEILNYIIVEELSNKEIADRLFISPRTVETHKRNLIQKLKVKNSIGLAKYYFENNQTLTEIYGIPLG